MMGDRTKALAQALLLATQGRKVLYVAKDAPTRDFAVCAFLEIAPRRHRAWVKNLVQVQSCVGETEVEFGLATQNPMLAGAKRQVIVFDPSFWDVTAHARCVKAWLDEQKLCASKAA